MASIKEKLKAEVRNDRTVRLWPEGTFYKAYERSAYLFANQVRQYEVRKRYVNVVGQNVVSIGFPQTVLKSLGVTTQTEPDGAVTFRVDTPVDEQQYLLWYDAIQTTDKHASVRADMIEKPVKSSPPALCGTERDVLKRLREFNLASATLLDCMMLLSELQTMLSKDNGH